MEKHEWDELDKVIVSMKSVGVICETPAQFNRIVSSRKMILQSEIVDGKLVNYTMSFVHYAFPDQVEKDNIHSLAFVTDWDIPSPVFMELVKTFCDLRGKEYGDTIRKALKLPDPISHEQRREERENYNKIKVFGEIG